MTKKLRIALISVLALVFALCMTACANCGSSDKKESKVYTIHVSTCEYALYAGESVKIDRTYGGEKALTFTSTDTAVATVDGDGTITAASAGIAYITVNAEDAAEAVHCKVNVSDNAYGISLGYSTLTLVQGTKKTLTAKIMLNGETVTEEITWSVTNSENCGFTASGSKATFTATEKGDYVITAKTAKGESNCYIKVVSENAQRLATPELSIEKCKTAKWNAVGGAKNYAVSIAGGDWTVVSFDTLSQDITQNVVGLKVNETITVAIKATAAGDYDAIDGYPAIITFKHDYKATETVDADCVNYGVMDYTCNDCGNHYTNDKYLEDHEYVDGVCKKCDGYQTEGLIYFFDDNYITIPSKAEASFAVTEENMKDSAWVEKNKNEWKVKYYDYIISGIEELYKNSINTLETTYGKTYTAAKLQEAYDTAKANFEKQEHEDGETFPEYDDAWKAQHKADWLASQKAGWFTNRTKLFDAVTLKKDSIPESSREKCYYLTGGADLQTGIIFVAGMYDDGVHGKYPVKYTSASCFERNETVTHVIFPDSVERLGHYTFLHASNMKYVKMCGVTDILEGYTGINCFLSNNHLQYVIVGKNFNTNDGGGQTFVSNTTVFDGAEMSIYAMEEGGTISLWYRDKATDVGLWTGNIYYYEESGTRCNTWKFAEDGYTVIKNDKQHNFVNGICVHCGETSVKYVYDEASNSYIVGDNTKWTDGEVVTVLGEYDDGVHGKLPVTAIADSAFQGGSIYPNISAIKKIILPDTVTTIGRSAFFNCYGLETIVMPGVTEIGQTAFYRCRSLTTMIIGKSIESTAHAVFCYGEDIVKYTKYESGEFDYNKQYKTFSVYALNDDVKFTVSGPYNQLWNDGSKNIYYYDEVGGTCKSTWTYDVNGNPILNGEIGTHTFENGVCKVCNANQTDGLKYTYNETLSGYVVSLESITSFSETEVYVRKTYNDGTNGEHNVVKVDENAFHGGSNYPNISAIKKIILPDTVTEIGDSAFFNCYGLETIVMPGVTTIGQTAFYRCRSLTAMIIGKSIESTAHAVFCYGEDKVKYTKYESGEFDYNTQYKTFSVYALSNDITFTVVGGNNQLWNDGSKNVYYYDEVGGTCKSTWAYDENGAPKYNGTGVHDYVDGACTHCGEAQTIGLSYEYYSSGSYSGYLVSDYTGSDLNVYVRGKYNDGTHNELDVIGVKAEAFQTLSGTGEPHEITRRITKIVLPSSVRLFGKGAFRNCFALETVIIKAEKIDSLGEEGNNWIKNGKILFENCPNLKSIVASSNVRINSESAANENFKVTAEGYTASDIQVFLTDSGTTTQIVSRNRTITAVVATDWEYDSNGNPVLK